MWTTNQPRRDSSDTANPSTLSRKRQISASVAVWALSQLALLGIGAAGFPLWAHHPLPRESLALTELLCGQIVLIAMLFPLLGSTILAVAINVMLMLPFDFLAGLLSNSPLPAILRCFAAVSLWVIGLGGWRQLLGNSRWTQLVVTLALIFSAGGAMWDYMAWEAALADGRGGMFRALSILPQICHLIEEMTWIAWVECAMPLLLLLPISLTSTLLHRHAKRPSTSLHTTP